MAITAETVTEVLRDCSERSPRTAAGVFAKAVLSAGQCLPRLRGIAGNPVNTPVGKMRHELAVSLLWKAGEQKYSSHQSNVMLPAGKS